ncbi:MAG TPA: protein kinase [Thermoanaerobaculia bacterium]|jgi:serine/threonine-protein kinase
MKPDLPADPERWQRIEALLDEMFDRPAEERRAFLDQKCAGDPDLRAHMESLRIADEEAGSFLATPASEVAAELLAETSGEGVHPLAGELGPYRLVREIGSGGMGVVYEAEDTRLRRRVAIKLLPPEHSRDRAAKDRFLREARAASALDDPHICTVHDVGEHDGRLYIVMTYYEGETLKERLARGPLPVDEARRIAIQVARALARAHEAGIVHRDIKPANVMLTRRGEVKVLDFGIAKMSGDTTLTRTGSSPGTPAYMSPEQARGEPVDGRTDLWSLGVLLYEMLAGRRPFAGDHEPAVLSAVQSREPERLDRIRPEVPPELARTVAKALAKEPGRRHQSAVELLAELETGKAPRQPVISRRRVLWAAVLLGICLLIATGWWIVRRTGKANAAPGTVASKEAVPVVGVVAFINRTGDHRLDWYGGAIARLIMDSLSSSRHLQVASEQRTADLARIENPTELARRAVGDGISVLLTGEILPTQGGLHVAARLQEMKRGRVLAARDIKILAPDRLLLTAEDIARAARKGLSVPPTEEVGGLAADFLARNPEAYGDYVRGLSAFLRFHYSEAEPSFRAALDKAPDFTMARYRLALVQRGTSRTNEALTNIRQAVSEADRLPDREARYVRAAEALIYRRTDEAVAIYRELIGKYPYEKEARFFLAEAFLGQRRYEDELSTLEDLKHLDPENSLVWSMAGEGELALRRFDRAAADLRKALELDPTNVFPLYDLGKMYKSLGEFDLAVQEFSEALRREPAYHAATLSLAEVDVLRNHRDQAEQRLRALAADPDVIARYRISAALDLASLYRSQGRFRATEKALTALSAEVAAEETRESTVLMTRGLSRLELGDVAGARRLLGEAVDRSTKDPGRHLCALFARGQLELRQQRWDAVEETFRELRGATAPSDDPKRGERAMADLQGLQSLAAGRPGPAVSELSSALGSKGYECSLYRLDLAQAYFAAAKLPEALAAARQAATDRDPADPRLDLELDRSRALLMLARVQMAMGQPLEAAASARQFLERWAKADPNLPDLAESRRLAALDSSVSSAPTTGAWKEPVCGLEAVTSTPTAASDVTHRRRCSEAHRSR